jgi:lambda family phage portal protein
VHTPNATIAYSGGNGNRQRATNQFQPRQQGQRSYDAAMWNRLTEDWWAPLTTGDAELRTRIRTIRNRIRELARNNPYARRFLSALENNVFDHHGINLQMKAGEWVKKKQGPAEFQLDVMANRLVETAWADWSRDPTVSGNMTLNAAMRIILTNTARDGDTLTKLLRGAKFNRFGFALQLMEGDIIDDYRNDRIVGQGDEPSHVNQVRMGVEVNPYMKPVAYWLLKNYPGDWLYWPSEGLWSDRYTAENATGAPNFIHLLIKDRITQVRGVSWLVTAANAMQMLDGFDEAAITAARVGAAKMGFMERPVPEGQTYTGEEDKQGNAQMEAEPGAIEELPYGMRFAPWDPAYPSEAYAPFVKACLRRIASGLGMSYNLLSSDLEGVNYSSIRAGVLDEREQWKAIQTWFIDRWLRPVFEEWLKSAMLSGQVNLPFAKFDKFNLPNFRPRRWDWVDPMKDVQADVIAINNRLKSRSEVISENGNSEFEEVIDEIAQEHKYAEGAGVEFPAIQAPPRQIATGDMAPMAPAGGDGKGEGKED